MTNLILIESPITKYWLTILRDQTTSAEIFRQACTALSSILANEAFKILSTLEFPIVTPMEPTIGYKISQDIYILPILRTGQLLVNGVLQTYPLARVLPIGIRRTKKGTLEEYDISLTHNDGNIYCLIVDGIVGTGNTLSRAIDICKGFFPNAQILSISLIGLRESFDYLANKHKDVVFFVSAFDREQNSDGYILPGVGDIRGRAYNNQT